MEWTGPDGTRYFLALNENVYRPSDDTFLLARAVEAHVKPGMRFLEVGCGAGLVSLVAAHLGAHVTCTDANPRAVALARHNARENKLVLEARDTDLMAGLPGPFDAIAFNPPYLPTVGEDFIPGPLNLAFDGGIDGNEVVLRFAKQLAALVPLPSLVLIVHSSLANPEPLRREMAALGYVNDVLLEEAHFFEKLTVQRFRRRDA
ncbi:MAG: HemK2/MTQ2 family protein methyltransferase [Candidatus Thermoplasmatota archaeon]